MRSLALIVTVSIAAAACAPDPPPVARESTHSQTPRKKPGLCQPFPDRLIDDLLAAYNGRDEAALKDLVTATQVHDFAAVGHAGTALFEDAVSWARAGWEADDRLRIRSYSAFSPTKHGFQLLLVRRNDALRRSGIRAISFTLDALSRGCEIVSLESSGPVQALGEPCAYYSAFANHAEIAAATPRACADGSGHFARHGHAAVWTGEEMIVLGGDRGGEFWPPDFVRDVLAFEPGKGWRIVGKLPEFLEHPQAVWTGREVLAVEGTYRGRGRGATLDPRTGAWREVSPSPQRGLNGSTAVWTGSELILWGGPEQTPQPRRRGAVYNPASDSWRRTSAAPICGRWWHAAVWTGQEMIVWGGSDARRDVSSGAAYNPANDSWHKIAHAPLSARQWHTMVWTGAEVIVWGGSSVSRAQANGAAYDPASDSWRKLPQAPLKGRYEATVQWTGREMMVWGGYDYRRPFRDGAAYDPSRDTWRKLPRAPLAPRCDHSAVWTGGNMIIFGGYPCSLGHIAFGDAGIFNPKEHAWNRLVPAL